MLYRCSSNLVIIDQEMLYRCSSKQLLTFLKVLINCFSRPSLISNNVLVCSYSSLRCQDGLLEIAPNKNSLWSNTQFRLHFEQSKNKCHLFGSYQINHCIQWSWYVITVNKIILSVAKYQNCFFPVAIKCSVCTILQQILIFQSWSKQFWQHIW